VNRISSPVSSRWALVLLAAATLALAGCGRKGPLDLPPNASTPAIAAAQTDTEAQREASKPTLFDPSYGTDAPPTAPKGTKKSFILDPLLGN
jgi:predicted small lipoprotein YifL